MTRENGNGGRWGALVAVALAAVLLAPTAWAQTPAEELDDNWVNVCAGATPGTAFDDRCEEILNAGPGGPDRRSDAALGNNLGVTAAQGRLSDEEVGGDRITFDLGRFSLFVTGSAARTERSASDFESGFESDDVGALLGVDFRLSDRASIGGLVQMMQADTDFDASAGSLDVESVGFTAFANLYPTETAAVSIYAGYGSLTYDSIRAIDYQLVLNAGEPDETTETITGTATGDTDGTRTYAGVAWSADVARGEITSGPEVRLDYGMTTIDGYAETDDVGLALRYADQSIRTLTAQAGYRVGRNVSTGFGVVVPSIRASYLYEFDDDPREIVSSFVGDAGDSPVIIRTENPDRNYFQLGGSISVLLRGGNTIFVDYQTLFSHRYLDQHQVSIGARFEL